MNKWFLRLSIALMTFILSVAVTGAFRFLFGAGPIDVIAVQAPRSFSDFSDDQAQIMAVYGIGA